MCIITAKMSRKISRSAYNLLLGRYQFKEEKMNFDRAKELLQYLSHEKYSKGRISFEHPDIKQSFFDKRTTPTESFNFVSRVFKPSILKISGLAPYFQGHHEVYYGKNAEMHYIELLYGIIHRSTPTEEANPRLFKKTTKRATLEFLVKNS